ncbi:hypothetical protein RvVAT039_pl12560 (plasmid) [Agrobacterium vitis]|nr:hypothetical protein RvVAT039_pl12560 [Agrobacterium vitis]
MNGSRHHRVVQAILNETCANDNVHHRKACNQEAQPLSTITLAAFGCADKGFSNRLDPGLHTEMGAAVKPYDKAYHI